MQIAVATYASIASHLVAPALTSLAVSRPDLMITVYIESEDGRLVDRLRTGSVECAVVERLFSPAGAAVRSVHPDHEQAAVSEVSEVADPADHLAALPLMDDRYRIVVPASWRPPGAVEELLDRPWVVGPPGSSVRTAVERMAHDARRPVPTPVYECCAFASVLDLVATGAGAAVVPDLALSRPPTGVAVTPFGDAGWRRLYALHRTTPAPTQAGVRAVVDALVASSRAVVQPARTMRERLGARAAVLGRSRTRIMTALLAPHTTRELARSLQLSESTVSHHLHALTDADLTEGHREGRQVMYRLTPIGRDLLSTISA